MKKLIKITFILLIFTFANCEKKDNELEFEKNVMTDIFPDLIDSTCIDIRHYTNFRPQYGEIIFDKMGHSVRVDSTKATPEQKAKLLEWKKRALEIKRDKSKLIIAFDPNIKESKVYSLKEDFEKHFIGSKIKISKLKNEKEFIFDFSKIKLNNKFELRNISKFPKDKDVFWLNKYDFVFSGAIFISRIEFDTLKKFGILDAGFACGGRCGKGYRIYIKKIENKWFIDEVIET